MKYFRVKILFPGGQISVCVRWGRQTKQKEPRCVHISFKVVTSLVHYDVNTYIIANSLKTVSPLSATLTLVQK